MSIREQLQADLKDAMKSGDETRKTVIRSVMAVFKEEEQQKREKLVKAALKKHNVIRPDQKDEAEVAAYDEAVAAALAAEKVDENRTLDDADQVGVVQRLVKQHHESIADAEKAGRTDLIGEEKAAIEILMAYLPKQLSREEIIAEAKAVIAEVGATESRDMGKVMGPLSAKLKGKADGKLISEVVRELLAQ